MTSFPITHGQNAMHKFPFQAVEKCPVSQAGNKAYALPLYVRSQKSLSFRVFPASGDKGINFLGKEQTICKKLDVNLGKTSLRLTKNRKQVVFHAEIAEIRRKDISFQIFLSATPSGFSV